MGLKIEKISTQIIPRDRHASLFSVFGIIASSIERLAMSCLGHTGIKATRHSIFRGIKKL